MQARKEETNPFECPVGDKTHDPLITKRARND